ncbi:hypothetical protein N8878_03330 [Psychromonas sp.]|nr:hypothetical protein [Psychromonas sp.]
MNWLIIPSMKRATTYSALFFILLFTHSIYAAEGYATRYWDACKPHCSWKENVFDLPMKTCNITNQVNPFGDEIASSCDGGDAYTCWDMAPKRISDTLSYGYAAVPVDGDICGKCFKLTFTGTGKYNDQEAGSVALKAKQKEMIVMASNIGYDVAGGQFDLLIPGGGVGAFNASSTQWQVTNEELGAQYGGFLTACQQEHGYNDTDTLKSCVQSQCDSVFDELGMEDLKSGCDWYVDWFEMADNPNLEYEEVTCPDALITGAYETVTEIEVPEEETPDPVDEPVTETPDPVDEPVTETPDPDDEPVTETPDPVDEPVTETPDPDDEPVTETPDPVDEPVIDIPEEEDSTSTEPVEESTSNAKSSSGGLLGWPELLVLLTLCYIRQRKQV